MINWTAFLMITFSYIAFVQSQCCVRKINGICFECPTDMHLFRNNCIYDVPNCAEYLDGFQCSICKTGYQLDQKDKSCIISDSPQGEIPENGFQELSITSQNQEPVIGLIEQSQQLNTNLTGLEIFTGFIRQTKTQQIYRLIFSSDTGFLETIYAINGPSTNVSLLGDKNFFKAPEQQFVTSLDDPIFETVRIKISETLPQFSSADQYPIVDAFRQNLFNSLNTSIGFRIRLFFLNKNRGLIQINSTISTFNPTAPEVSIQRIQLDIQNLDPKIQRAIQDLVLRNEILETDTLTALIEIQAIQGQNISSTYNASFLSLANNCAWIQFSIITGNTSQQVTLTIARGTCQAPPIPFQCIPKPNQVLNISYTEQINLDNFIISENVFLLNYLNSCQRMRVDENNPDIISAAIGQNSTSIFTLLRIKIFSQSRQIFFLSLVRNKNGLDQPSLIQSFFKPQNEIKEIYIPIQVESNMPSISLTIIEAEIIDFLESMIPEISDNRLISLESFQFTRSNMKFMRFSLKYTSKENQKYQQRQFTIYRIEKQVQTGTIKLLPQINVPKENYRLISIPAIFISQFQIISIARQLISSQESLPFVQLLRSLDRQQTYLISFLNETKIQKYFIQLPSDLPVEQRKIVLVEIFQSDKDFIIIDLDQLLNNSFFVELLNNLYLLFQEDIINFDLELKRGVVQSVSENSSATIETIIITYQSSDDSVLNVTVNVTRSIRRFSIINRFKSWQTNLQNSSSYELVSIQIFEQKFAQILIEFQLFSSTQQSELTFFQSEKEVVIREETVSRLWNISLTQEITLVQTNFQIMQNSQIEPFMPSITEQLEIFGFTSISTVKLLLTQNYFGKAYFRHTTQIILSDQKRLQLLFETVLNSLAIFPIALQNLALAQFRSVNYSEPAIPSQEQQENLKGFFSPKIQVISIQFSLQGLKLYRLVIRNKKLKIDEIIIQSTSQNFKAIQILSIKAIDKGFNQVGFGVEDLYGQYNQKLIIFESANRKRANQILSGFNASVQQIKEHQLILWKVKILQDNTKQLETYYQLQDSSFVLKVKGLQMAGKKHEIVQIGKINNNMLKMREQQNILIQKQTQEIISTTIYKQIQAFLLANYWYYLRGSKLVSIRKIEFVQITYFIGYFATRNFYFEAVLKTTKQNNSIDLVTLNPYNERKSQNFRQIYRCAIYSQKFQCRKCDFGFILDTNNKCFPKIPDCEVQSGDQCIFSYLKGSKSTQ